MVASGASACRLEGHPIRSLEEAQQVHRCATAAMRWMFLDHVSEFRSVEKRLAELDMSYADNARMRADLKKSLRQTDAAYMEFFSSLPKLNDRLRAGEVELRLIRLPGPDREGGSSATLASHNRQHRRMSYTFQTGSWKVVFRVPDASWSNDEFFRLAKLFPLKKG